MVNVRNLSRVFRDDAGEFAVIRDASFTVEKGEMIALLGVSGAGKTTLLQILGGLDRPTSGRVEIGGKMLDGMSAGELAAFRNLSIGFVFQFHHLLPDFTAIENVMIPGLITGKTRRQCLPKARELLDSVGLSNRCTHFPTELSGGERQRVAFARALFNDPALVLADEPTGNLDRENGENLMTLFRSANRRFRQTLIMATHNDRLAEGMDRALRVDDGNVISCEPAPAAAGHI